MTKRIPVIAAACMLVFGLGQIAYAQPVATTNESAPAQQLVTEIRTYNIADLLRASAPDKSSVMPPVDTDALLKTIYELIDTDSWRDNGGTVGQVQVLGPTLIIQQTAENHARIAKLLEQIRTEQGPVQLLNIRAYWLNLDAGEVRSVLDASAKAGQSLPVVSDDMFNEKRIYCVAEASSFSGRDVILKSTREQTYVSDVTPIVGQDSVGYDPDPKQASSGVTLAATPQLTSDGQVLLNVRSVVNELVGMSQATMPAQIGNPTSGPAGGPVVPGTIDRISVITHEFQTNLRMPTGKKILIGGMTLDPAGKGEPARQLYLVMEIDVAK